jgi:tRNA 2-thiouridine synthesizing protein A
MSWIEVDARGLRCPWPALRLARAVRQGARNVRLRADDPAAPREIAALAAERGWQLKRDGEDFLVQS